MKKGLLFILLAAASVCLPAQEKENAAKSYTVETNRFGANWFISGGIGAQMYFGDNDGKADFGKRLAPALDIAVGKGRIDLLLQRLLVGGDLLGIALDGHGKVVRALNARRAAAHKRDRRGQRNVAIARRARHLAGVVAPTIAGRPNDIAVGALPANLELALGARTVRKRKV